jgi:hypothetical protein
MWGRHHPDGLTGTLNRTRFEYEKDNCHLGSCSRFNGRFRATTCKSRTRTRTIARAGLCFSAARAIGEEGERASPGICRFKSANVSNQIARQT